MEKRVRTRFAPSPTGYMHIGNLRTALYAYLIAKKKDGDFILRIEDTDQERYVEGAVDVIYDTLRVAGLNWDEGPDIGGPVGPYVQSERMGMFKSYAEELVKTGHAYYSFFDKERLEEVRKIQEASHIAPMYDRHCRNLSPEEIQEKLDAGIPYVIRQKMPLDGTTTFHDDIYGDVTVENSTLDDQILIKTDGMPTYNFANIIDDHMMDITHVVRGNEYLSSTPKYNLIYQAFDWKIPTYIHCPPVMKDEQHKLSKRNGDASFQDLVAKGYLPEAIINYIALLGWAPESEQEIYSLEELKKAFNVKRINTSGAIFDIEKLTWMNGMYLRKMELEEFYELVLPYINQAVKTESYDKKEIAKILQTRVSVLNEIPEMIDFFDNYPVYSNDLYINKKMKTNEEISLNSLIAARKELAGLTEWSETSIHDTLMNLVQTLGIKNGQLLFPVRIAVSGKQMTPGGAIEIAEIIGKEETLRRIDASIAQLQK